MKKLAILLLGVLPLVMSSCLKEENDYFDKSASDRLEEAVANLKKRLNPPKACVGLG